MVAADMQRVYINYRLKSEIAITLCCYTCSLLNMLPTSTNREAFEKQLVIKVASMKKCGKIFIMKGKPSCATTKLTLFTDGWNIKEGALVSPRRMHCTYSGMPKGTSQAEVMSNSEISNV